LLIILLPTLLVANPFLAISYQGMLFPQMNMSMSDPFDLNRFVDAQDAVYGQVLAELRSGRKSSHWIWYIFPQIRGLGYSLTTRKYAIQSIDEARAYLDHTLLGKRLVECTRLVLNQEVRDIRSILGYPDDLKFRSSMTLFAQVSDDKNLFEQALEQYFRGEADVKTLKILGNVE